MVRYHLYHLHPCTPSPLCGRFSKIESLSMTALALFKGIPHIHVKRMEITVIWFSISCFVARYIHFLPMTSFTDLNLRP